MQPLELDLAPLEQIDNKERSCPSMRVRCLMALGVLILAVQWESFLPNSNKEIHEDQSTVVAVDGTTNSGYAAESITSSSSSIKSSDSSSSVSSSSFSSPTVVLPMTSDAWTVVYDSLGSVNFSSTSIVYAPRVRVGVSIKGNNTSAVLLLSNDTLSNPVKDMQVRIRVATLQQLRIGATPNKWEVFWLFFNYQGHPFPLSASNKTTNYFMFKTNGIEIGTAFNDRNQSILNTSDIKLMSIGTTYEWLLTKVGQAVNVSINGALLMQYRGVPEKYIFDQPGNIGLYCEDSRIQVFNVSITRLS